MDRLLVADEEVSADIPTGEYETSSSYDFDTHFEVAFNNKPMLLKIYY